MIAGSSIVWAAALATMGLAVGSFVGLLTLRLPAGRPWAAGRSRCDGCGRSLTAGDLVPLLSWALARGHCRVCAAPVPLRYPLLEAGCAAIGLWAAANAPPERAALSAAFGWWLVLIAVIDAEHFWLPRALTLPLLVAGLAVHIAGAAPSLSDSVLGAASGWAGLALLAALFKALRGRQGLGGGDPPMLGAVGAWVGWQGLPASVLVAALAGLALAAVQGRLKPGTKLPLGTLLALGGWLVWLYGPSAERLVIAKAPPVASVENVRRLRTPTAALANGGPVLFVWSAAPARKTAWPSPEPHRTGSWGEDGRAG